MNETTSLPTDTKTKKTWDFLQRWQDFLGWLPITVLLGVLAWVFLGGLDRTALKDVLPLWIVLPVKVGYALAALGLTHLARRRWRINMTEEQKSEYWILLMSGARTPIIMLIADAVVTLCLIKWLLAFFNLPS